MGSDSDGDLRTVFDRAGIALDEINEISGVHTTDYVDIEGPYPRSGYTKATIEIVVDNGVFENVD